MWTLSGFADEIDPDLATQCATLNDLGITHVEFRSAWGTNVLDLTDEQIESAAAILADQGLSLSSIGSPLGIVPTTSMVAPSTGKPRASTTSPTSGAS